MAGAFSGHLLDSFNAAKPMTLSYSGPMSFNSSMHGSQAFTPYAFGTQSSFMSEEISEATAKKIASLQAKLNQKLGPEYISQRPGPGGVQKFTYAEGWKIINLANEVFGFNGWSSNLVNLTTDFVDYSEESKRYTVGVTAIVRVTLRDGVYHEDIGYGMLENSKSKGMALDKCKKEAVTDGLKRALRNFGNLLGNCLYDKAYTQEVVKMKVVPAKFDASELHRRPEFDTTLNTNTTPAAKPSNNTSIHPVQQQSSGTPSSLPPRIKKELRSVSNPTNGSDSPQTSVQHQITPVSVTRDRISPQANQQSQRKVTFSNAPNKSARGPISRPTEPIASSSKTGALESETDNLVEESFGYSEDDAFFASVDLGDLDKPIEDDGDIGRPINFDEDQDSYRFHIGAPPSKPGPATGMHFNEDLNHPSMDPVTTKDSHRFHVGAPPPKPGPATGMLSALLPQQPRRVPQGQNIPPAKPMTYTKRTATPSIGGFHFPSGMDPFDQNKFPRAGVKRSEREVLGQLEIGDGGNVKRTKR